MKVVMDELNPLDALVSADANTIVLKAFDWSELARHHAIAFSKLERRCSISSGDYLDTRGTVDDIRSCIRRCLSKYVGENVLQARILLWNEYQQELSRQGLV